MARRIRFAGQEFDFPTVVDQKDDGTKSESVLATYFPEVNLSFSPKSSRGGRLGRSPQSVTPEIAFRQAQQAAGGAAAGGAAAGAVPGAAAPTSAPTTATPTTIKIERPAWLDELFPKESGTTKAPETPKAQPPALVEKRTLKSFTPRVANPQTVDEAIGYLYETQLGRTPTKEETQSWAGRQEFADKGLSAQEWDSLRGAFQESPEYKGLSEMVPASTPKDTGRSLFLNREFTPTNASPQTPEEAVKYLYQTQLGRTPSESETASWTANPVFADKGLSTEEWGSLIAGFKASPEYQMMGRK